MWYPQDSAANSLAAFSIADKLYTVEVNGDKITGHMQRVSVSDRLANVERKLTLEDGSIFATADNDGVDELFRGHIRSNRFIHTLESHFGFVLVALAITLALTFAFFKWGVPWTSTKIAHSLPHKTNELIANNTLEFLDKFIFDKSKLDSKKIEQITRHFETRIIELEENLGEVDFKLSFRAWSDGDKGIPNALALPSGDIILTDTFVELSQTQDEIDAVLLHEMGHVMHRHSLQMVIKATMVTTVVMMVTGDSNGLADLGLGLGSLLVSSNYSRGHESEADIYAFEHMLKAKIDPQAFSDIMNRMTEYMLEPNKTKEKVKEVNKSNGESKRSNKVNGNSILDYLSSHPSTAERVELAEQYSECFKQSLKLCVIDVL